MEKNKKIPLKKQLFAVIPTQYYCIIPGNLKVFGFKSATI